MSPSGGIGMAREVISKSRVLEKLSTRHDRGETRVVYDGVDIGKIVRYGKAAGFSRARVKTVYGSRIYGKVGDVSVRIEEEAGSARPLLDKVAAAIAKKLKASVSQPATAAPPADAPETEEVSAPRP